MVDLPAYHLKCLIRDVLAVCYDPRSNYVLYISVVSVVFTVFLLCFIVLYMVLLLRRNKQ